jgi:triacylglycerol lipase
MTNIEKIKFAWNNIIFNKGIENVEGFRNETDTEGYTGIYKDYFIIHFDSTNFFQWKDIMTDAFFFKKVVPYDNYESPIRVHSGFINSYKSIRLYLHKKFKNSGKEKVFISGHSLGGALTTCCAIDFQYNFTSKIEAVAFGCPRIGNKAFADSFNKRVPQFLRVAQGQDIATKLPPFWFFFKHVDNLIEIGKKRWWLFFGSIKDHYHEKYKKAIDKL